LHGGVAYSTGGTWSFYPPPGTSLGAFAVTWSGTVTPGGESTLSRSDELDPDYVERNVQSFSSHTVAEGGFDIAALNMIVACSFNPQACPGDPAADFTISRAVMTTTTSARRS
jgi:hypothetical protein